MKVLGVQFFEGNVSESLCEAQKGGLVVAPSGPGLSKDLIISDAYRLSLKNAEIVLPDSGLLCLWLKIFKRKHLRRISGLEFLKQFLDYIDPQAPSFWVMPDKVQSEENLTWLRKVYRFEIDNESVYQAPLYEKEGPIKDEKLLSMIESKEYNYIFIQLGGGVQERLGLYLRQNLSYKPTILCTGAALAFLSGVQIRIPNWADKYYLGWLLRCFSNPQIFIPRYLAAFRLIYLLLKHGKKSPV